jgi:hypothetical protein
MDFSYRIDKATRIVYLEGDDPSFEVWQQTMLAVFADPDLKPASTFYLTAALLLRLAHPSI